MTSIMNFVKGLNWSARVGLMIVLFFAFCAAFAPWLAPYGESEIVGDVWEPLFGEFVFGTDLIGRDMLSRLIYGARNTIVLALLTTALSFFAGALMGFLAATLGGWVDQLLSRIVDIVISIPTLICALIIVSAVGTSFFVLAIVIGIIYAMPVYRIARAVAMDIEVMDYVEAARLRGENIWWIMRREILPTPPPNTPNTMCWVCLVCCFLFWHSFGCTCRLGRAPFCRLCRFLSRRRLHWHLVAVSQPMRHLFV